MNNTWEHPFQKGDKTEPTQSFEAFQIWLEMGNKRSLKAVAERVEKSHDTIKKYSCTWKWSERLQDKLSYENKQIHAKQLEAIMTSLDIDSNRDLYIQNILGNIMWDMYSISSLGCDKLVHTDMEGKLRSPTIEALERLTNIYVKLEKVHTDTQNKFIDMNKKCLSVHEFDKQADYMKVLANGRKQQLEIDHAYKKITKEFSQDDVLNRAGENLKLTPSFQPLGMYDGGKHNKWLDGDHEKLDNKEDKEEV